MISNFRIRVLLRLGAVYLLLTSGLFSASEVQAGCGDYLTYGSGKQAMEHSPIDLDAASNSPFVPCHGPQCSQQQSHSKLPVPTTVRPPAPDDWAVSAIQVMAKSLEGSLLPPIQIAGSPFDFSRLIFHPPRV